MGPASGNLVQYFCKPAFPGNVKTRLAADLGPEVAASVYRALIRHCLNQPAGVKGPGGGQMKWTRHLWVLKDNLPNNSGARLRARQEFFSSLSDRQEQSAEFMDSFAGFPLFYQTGEDLGARMAGALLSAASLTRYRYVLLTGTDIPDAGPDKLARLFGILEESGPVALGPATDGGYYALGLDLDWLRGWQEARTEPLYAQYPLLAKTLFDGIRWSRSDVLEKQKARLTESGLHFAEGPVASDIDTDTELRDFIRLYGDGGRSGGGAVPENDGLGEIAEILRELVPR